MCGVEGTGVEIWVMFGVGGSLAQLAIAPAPHLPVRSNYAHVLCIVEGVRVSDGFTIGGGCWGGVRGQVR